jgi:hypothetical protein
MPTIRRISAAAAAVLLTAGVGLTAAAPAATAHAAHAGVEARSVLPYTGHYLGRDGHHRLVKFYYNGHSLEHVTVNGHLIVSSAPVSGATVHHRCDSHTNKCVRGHWSWDTEFQGTWNDPRQGVESHFVADLYSH